MVCLEKKACTIASHLDQYQPDDLVSVVVPTKNRLKSLSRTVCTIASQDYKSIEIIISDDGSDPNVAHQLKGFESQSIKVINSEISTGVAGARNRGLKACKGKWVSFCDDDDMWVATKISNQLELLRRESLEWCCSKVLHIDSHWQPIFLHEGQFVEDSTRIYFENTITGGGSSAIVRKSLLERVGGFDERFSMFADWELWTRLYQHANPKIVSEIGVLYLEHGSAMSANQKRALSEIKLYKSLYKYQRSTYRNKHEFEQLEPTDQWVFDKMLKAGHFLDSIMILQTYRPGILYFKIMAKIIKRFVNGRPVSHALPLTEAKSAAIRDVKSRIEELAEI